MAEVAEEQHVSLAKRLIDVMFSPGRLMESLARRPVWVGALFVSVALVTLQVGLIPPEVYAAAQREAALRAGQDLPELSVRALRLIRLITPVFTAVSTTVISVGFAGIYTFIFAFILGDDGEFRQYLAAVSHAWFIPGLIGLFLTPIRISTADPQFSLNLASFAFFLPEGYIVNVLKVMDLTQIWATLVVAQGAHAIDPRRSFGSAAGILLAVLLLIALVIGRFLPT